MSSSCDVHVHVYVCTCKHAPLSACLRGFALVCGDRDTDDPDRVEFGEFLQAIVTYCLFETMEILKMCFFIYDRDKNGYVEQGGSRRAGYM